MAHNACLFLTFGAFNPPNLTLVGAAKQDWSGWSKPPGVYHYAGVATEDATIGPVLTPTNNPIFSTWTPADSSGAARSTFQYGCRNATYGAATTPSYSSWDAAKGFQIGVKRSTYSIGSEVWCSFDWKYECLSNSSISGFEPTANYKSVFRWGDVEIRAKSTTWTGSSHTFVFSIRNNGSEVTTLSVTGVTNSTKQFMRIHVKLDATTGLIECDCNGTAQAASYTGQNTVATTSLASATYVYVGPPILDNNSTGCYAGAIAHVYFSTVGWSSGRPIAQWFAFGNGAGYLADGTMTNWLAQGTGATTVSNALLDYSDAKAARGYGYGAEALFTLPTLTTGNLSSSLLSIEIHGGKACNRDLVSAKRLSFGMSLSGVPTMGTAVAALALPTDTVSTPPATNYTPVVSEFFVNPAYTLSDWTNLRVRMVVL